MPVSIVDFGKTVVAPVRPIQFAFVAAAASASPVNWLVSNWWNAANKVYDFAVNDNARFTDIVNGEANDGYIPLWNLCGGDDNSVSSDELTGCGAKIAAYVDMSEGTQNYLYEFGSKYWSVVDADRSGDLSFDEFKP